VKSLLPAWVNEGDIDVNVGTGFVLHAFHWQLALHDWVPPLPLQDWLAFGAQTPSPLHVDHPDHVPLLHVLV
jgi:hypothetical protein